MAFDGGGSPHDLVVQTWIMYSIAITLFVLRIYARYKRLGLRWLVEDYLMVLAVCLYTAFAVTNIAIAKGGGSSLYLPGQFETFTPDDIAERVKGSKIEFASENCQLCAVYTLKACMLLVYYRITSNLWQHRLVKLCAAYTFLGWLTTELVLFLNCHPVSGYWTLPPPQRECATYFRYEVTQCVFNITSDIAILGVILPLLFRMKMHMRQKLPLLVIFSMGIVVIACAITSKYFTFRDIYDASYQFWYLREVSIGVYVTNLPFVWSLVRSTVGFLKTSDQRYLGRVTDINNHPSKFGTGQVSAAFQGRSAGGTTHTTASSTGGGPRRAYSESEEHIMEMGGVGAHNTRESRDGTADNTHDDGMDWSSEGRPGLTTGPLVIKKTTEIVVRNLETE